MRTRSVFMAIVTSVAAVAVPAHGAQVYIGDGDTGCVWAFSDTVGTVLNEQSPFASIEGMSIASDGQLLIADAQMGIALLNPETGGVTLIEPQAPGPADVYPNGESEDIYYVTPGEISSLWVLIGGTAPGQHCLSFPGAALDLQVYPLSERAGHVLVLVDRYGEVAPRLAEFVRTGPTTFDELPPVLAAIPGDPASFAIRPNGEIILLDRSTGMYVVGPEGQLTHFGEWPEQSGWEKIDIGADGIIYVTDTHFAMTHRFDPDGNWIWPDLEAGVQVPAAVAAAGFTPTPPGPNVPVTPTPGVEILFELVAGGGYTSADTTTTQSRVSPGGNTLPDFAVPPTGRDGFTYVSLATTAVFENLIQVDVLLPGSRLFYAHGTDQVFHDVTIRGSLEDARGVVSRFSEVVVVDDVRPAGEVVDDKFAGLMEVLQSPPEDPPELREARAHLRSHAQTANAFYMAGQALSAVTELSFMNGDIRNWAGTVIPNSSDSPGGNLAGEMLSRSKTLMFSLWFLVPPSGVPTDGSVGADASLSLTCASPARGECRFELAGPSGARVTARLYTVNGSLVKTLFEGDLTDGGATLSWDGTDRDGRRVASGVYLTRVESGDALVMGKVVFVR
jgi:hypothetical protein